jgi:hypothetical protein
LRHHNLLERLDHERGVDAAVGQCRRHLGEPQLHVLDRVRVDAGFQRRRTDRQFHHVLEDVDRDLLAGEVLHRRDWTVPRHHQRAEVGAVDTRRVVAVVHHPHRQALRLREQQRHDIAVAEFQIAAQHRGYRLRAGLRGLERQVDVPLLEETLLLPQIDRGDVEDRDQTDLDVVGLARVRRPRFGTASRHHQQQNDNRDEAHHRAPLLGHRLRTLLGPGTHRQPAAFAAHSISPCSTPFAGSCGLTSWSRPRSAAGRSRAG